MKVGLMMLHSCVGLYKSWSDEIISCAKRSWIDKNKIEDAKSIKLGVSKFSLLGPIKQVLRLDMKI